jgi:hypothetical protein
LWRSFGLLHSRTLSSATNWNYEVFWNAPGHRELIMQHEPTEGETVMPVLFVPLLIGIPVLIGGSFIVYKIVGG